MDCITAIAQRLSYRGMYRDDPVPREDLQTLLEAGLAAPSGCNKQTTSLIAIDDPALIGALGGMLRPHFASAPAAICVLTQRLIAYEDTCFSVHDYSAAIENILLAVTAMGYASCWVEGHVTGKSGVAKRMAEALGVPESYDLVAYLPIGLPAEQGVRVKRKPFEARAWFNGFGKA